MRVGTAGRGKSYGARVIYYFQSAEDTVYLLLAYSKTEADDLSPAGREVLKEIIQQL
jgi:mRNA-degrading endonuclease RelE of RelBE toxin-antitoxin system